MGVRRCERWSSRDRAVALAIGLPMVLATSRALAGEFDPQGRFQFSSDAAVTEAFQMPADLGAEPGSQCPGFYYEIVASAESLEGDSQVVLYTPDGCAARFGIDVPSAASSFRASLWIRHGGVDARIVVEPEGGSGAPARSATLAPTGRSTSDGWIELASNAFPVDGSAGELVHLSLEGFASTNGVEVDALELVPEGEFRETPECDGVRDDQCGDEALCIAGHCRLLSLSVPPAPEGVAKDEVVDSLEGLLDVFFGGRRTRLDNLPAALGHLEAMREAQSAWAFWSGWGRATHALNDSHSLMFGGPVVAFDGIGALDACFMEGDADASWNVVPQDVERGDVLVAYVGAEPAGLKQGDRLVAVDGMHPLDWVKSLEDVNWSHGRATDARAVARFYERLGGGGALIMRFAKTLDVIHCDPAFGCDSAVETIQVASIRAGGGTTSTSCDNRPFYHLGQSSPPSNHVVGFDTFVDVVDGTTPEESIYGVVMNSFASDAMSGLEHAADVVSGGARGIIIDHRRGDGGTTVYGKILANLARPPEHMLSFALPIISAGFEGPATAAEGVELFADTFSTSAIFVGHQPPLDVPIAVLLHRDVSASDTFSWLMSTAPRARLFGLGPTDGAFSTLLYVSYWQLGASFGSGDMVDAAGGALLGVGVTPHVVVRTRRSDLLAGVDTVHEAALAWLRQEIAP